MASANYVTTSTELMLNYKQTELFDQTDAFRAVQTADGQSLFFGQGSDGGLWLVREQSGLGTGWSKINLVANLTGRLKTFAVGQGYTDGDIDVAAVMTDPAGTDSLYLAQGLSNQALGWTAGPLVWVSMPDDRVGASNPKLVVDDVHIANTNDGTEYVIVDTVDLVGNVARYWINPTGAPHWNAHPLAFNIQAAGPDQSFIGRKAGDPVNGIYTLGIQATAAQFVYTPLFNPFAPSIAPNPTNFDLSATGITGQTGAFGLCPALSGAADATDLFIAGAGGLFYLAAEAQSQMAKPQPVFQHAMFGSMRELHANVQGGRVVVWGLNDVGQVFYTACPLASIAAQGWSVPLPLMSAVSQISPYLNEIDGALTIFANAAQGALSKAVQDPVSSNWLLSSIELPPVSAMAASVQAKSYTTTLHVFDGNDLPLAGAAVTLTPGGRANVYINNVYYALQGGPVTVSADGSGVVTVVEWIDGLNGTSFAAAVAGGAAAVAVQPERAPLARLAPLTTVAGLQAARVTNPDGSTSALLPAGLGSNDTAALAQSLADLNTVQGQISAAMPRTGPKAGMYFTLPMAAATASPIDYIEVLWGDLVEALEHFGQYVVQLVKDTAADVWHFIVTVGQEVYGFVVDTVAKVAGALEAIWAKIAKGFEDLWNYLKYIFDWQDMLLTRDVYKQMVKIFLGRIADDIQTAKQAMDTAIGNAEGVIKTWAAAAVPPLGTANGQVNGLLQNKPTNPGLHSAPGQFLKGHFSNNVAASVTTQAAPTVAANPTWSGLTDLSSFVAAEDATITDLKNQFVALVMTASNQAANPDLETILKTIVADIAVAALDLFQMAADKVLDFLTLLIEDAIDLLDAPIQIPVVSDILKDLFGITQLPSVLDILCLVAAVPVTIGYKIVHKTAPFVAGPGTTHDKITSATTYAQLLANFQQTGDLITLPADAEAVLFETCYAAAGIATIVKGVLEILDEEADGGGGTVLATPKSVCSVLASIPLALAGLFALPMGIQNATMKEFASILGKIGIAKTVGFAVAPKAIAKIKGISGDGPLKALGQQITTVSTGVDAVLGFVGIVPQAYHFIEILVDGQGASQTGVLGIMDSTQSITAKLGTIAGFAALVDTEEVSKQVLVVIQGVLILITGGLLVAEAVTETITS